MGRAGRVLRARAGPRRPPGPEAGPLVGDGGGDSARADSTACWCPPRGRPTITELCAQGAGGVAYAHDQVTRAARQAAATSSSWPATAGGSFYERLGWRSRRGVGDRAAQRRRGASCSGPSRPGSNGEQPRRALRAGHRWRARQRDAVEDFRRILLVDAPLSPLRIGPPAGPERPRRQLDRVATVPTALVSGSIPWRRRTLLVQILDAAGAATACPPRCGGAIAPRWKVDREPCRAPARSRQQAMSAASVASPTNTATGTSPRRSSGQPTTAASRDAGDQAQHLLDLLGEHLVPTSVDEVRRPPLDPHEALGVDPRMISRADVALRVDPIVETTPRPRTRPPCGADGPGARRLHRRVDVGSSSSTTLMSTPAAAARPRPSFSGCSRASAAVQPTTSPTSACP